MPVDLSIIVPAFNEEECLGKLVEELGQVISGELRELSVEVIVVDDHSTDNTQILLREAAQRKPWLHSLRLLRNSGSHVAIFAGMSRSKGTYAFIMGADLQDPPQIISEFLKVAQGGYKIVLGERAKRKDPVVKRIPSAIFNFFMCKFVLPTFPVNGGDVFLVHRDVIDAVLRCEEKNVNIFVLMLSLYSDVGTYQYTRNERFAGSSKWNFGRLFKLAFDSVITVGYLPLRIIFRTGIILFFLSSLFLLYLVVAKATGVIRVEGWTSVLAAITTFGSLNLVSLAVVGEYLWRNYDQTRKRPMFIVESESKAE